MSDRAVLLEIFLLMHAVAVVVKHGLVGLKCLLVQMRMIEMAGLLWGIIDLDNGRSEMGFL